jgi:fatty acid desaturase
MKRQNSPPGASVDQANRDSLAVGLLKNRWAQAYLTWLTGIPHTGQTMRKRKRLENLVAALGALCLGIFISHTALQAGVSILVCSVLLLLGYSHTLYALRCLRLPNFHYACHYELTQNRAIDRAIGLLIGTALLIPPVSSYQRQHIEGPGRVHHKWSHLLTPGEDTFEVIKSYGFQPGAPRRAHWARLWLLLANPWFYMGGFAKGLRGTFFSRSVVESVFSMATWLILAVCLTRSNAWAEFALIWFMPRVLFFEAAQVFRNLVEHYFPRRAPGERTPGDFRGMTKAIFAGEPAPQLDTQASSIRKGLAWCRWGLRMLVLHLPARLWVLTGDTPCHDLHHVRPGSDWANYEVERQKLEQSGWPLEANWGMQAAMSDFFDSLSMQPATLFSK